MPFRTDLRTRQLKPDPVGPVRRLRRRAGPNGLDDVVTVAFSCLVECAWVRCSRAPGSAGWSSIPEVRGRSNHVHVEPNGQGGVIAMTTSRVARVRELNDAMRIDGPAGAGPNRWVFTRGALHLGADTVAAIVQSVRSFDAFDEDNDPHGEHDFGVVELAGVRLFWKIDYYDRSFTVHSPDPADPEVTVRVLTLMLAEEY